MTKAMVALSLGIERMSFCHKFLASELVSKEEVDANLITKQVGAFQEGRVGFQGSQLHSVKRGPDIERVADHPEAYIAYRLTYRCKDCGKEWTRLSVDQLGIPKSYVEDEEEKTEYDAEKEAKKAREEEYAREERR